MLPLWRCTLVAISLVLFCQYSLRVFASNDYLLSVKHHQRNNVLCLSGLIRCEDDITLETTFSNLELSNLKLYLPYYGLLITFIIGYFILTSENYKNLMDDYIDREVHLQQQAKKDQAPLEDAEEVSLDASENKDLSDRVSGSGSQHEAEEGENEGRDNSRLRHLLKNAVLLCDPVTKWFIQYSLYLLIFSMALLSTTLPLALTNVLLLIVMTVLVLRALTYEDQISLYRNSRVLLYMIKYGALISIAARYLAQFYLLYMMNERIVDPSLTKEEDSEFYHVTALLFGYTSDFFVVRLISLTLILIISNLQLGMLKNHVLMEIIVEADQIITNRAEPMTIGAQLKVYIVFVLYSLLPVGLLGVIFLLVAVNPSLLGLIAMFATVIILSKHQSTFWGESYKNIGIFTQIFVLVTYSLDFFIFVAADRYPWFVDSDEQDSSYSFLMNALHSNLEYFNKDQKFFTRIFWMYVILAFCFLQKRIHRYGPYFKLMMPEKPKKAQTITLDAMNAQDRDEKE